MPKQDAIGRWISDDGTLRWDGQAWRPIEPQSIEGDIAAKPGFWAKARTSMAESQLRSQQRAAAANAARRQRAVEADAARLEQDQEQQRQREASLAERAALYRSLQSSCPLPLIADLQRLPGGLTLQPDEFLVAIGKDWGTSSQRLTLTTHRLIHSHGRLTKDQEIVFLTDIRDIKFRKPMFGYGTLAIETAGGRSLEGLPAASQAAAQRDRLLAMVHWARQRATQPTGYVQAAVVADKYDQLRKLAELRATGALNDQEFEAEKSKLLSAP